MEVAAGTFFASKQFAVAGASQVPQKFGYKILAWYHARSLAVTPITPARPTILVQDTSYATVASPSDLSHPTETSLSIVTPPAITKEVLREAKEAGVPAVWLQPGTYDAEILEYAKREFKAGVGGTEPGTHDGQGWCVLVDGDEALQAATESANDKGRL